MNEMNLLGDALKQQSLKKGNNWPNETTQELKRLDMGDVRRNLWTEVSKRCVDTEGQNMEASMKKKRLLVFYNQMKSNRGKIIYRSMHPGG
jgi:hypothetical protein